MGMKKEAKLVKEKSCIVKWHKFLQSIITCKICFFFFSVRFAALHYMANCLKNYQIIGT